MITILNTVLLAVAALCCVFSGLLRAAGGRLTLRRHELGNHDSHNQDLGSDDCTTRAGLMMHLFNSHSLFLATHVTTERSQCGAAKVESARILQELIRRVFKLFMSGIIPNAPHFFIPETDARPVCEWVMPAAIPKQGYANACTALPRGMPSCLEVCVTHTNDSSERTTAAIYGTRAYLIHYEYKPKRRWVDL